MPPENLSVIIARQGEAIENLRRDIKKLEQSRDEHIVEDDKRFESIEKDIREVEQAASVSRGFLEGKAAAYALVAVVLMQLAGLAVSLIQALNK